MATFGTTPPPADAQWFTVEKAEFEWAMGTRLITIDGVVRNVYNGRANRQAIEKPLTTWDVPIFKEYLPGPVTYEVLASPWVPRKGALSEFLVAVSHPLDLIEDMWFSHNTDLPRAERRERISQARSDDAALPQTRFGDYPD